MRHPLQAQLFLVVAHIATSVPRSLAIPALSLQERQPSSSSRSWALDFTNKADPIISNITAQLSTVLPPASPSSTTTAFDITSLTCSPDLVPPTPPNPALNTSNPRTWPIASVISFYEGVKIVLNASTQISADGLGWESTILGGQWAYSLNAADIDAKWNIGVPTPLDADPFPPSDQKDSAGSGPVAVPGRALRWSDALVVVQSQITYLSSLSQETGATLGEEGFWLDIVVGTEGGEDGTRRLAEGALVRGQEQT